MKRYESYKDSGVKWLGEIPGHWEVLPLKYIFKLQKKLVGRNSNKYKLLSLTLQGIKVRDLENPTGKFPSSFDSYQIVEPGDFIFCNFDNEETPRAVGQSKFKGMITGAYDVFGVNNNNMDSNYLLYYCLYIDDAKRFKPLYKGLRKTIPFDSFMSYKIAIPPKAEQTAIANYLDSVTSKIDEAISQQQKMIDLLNERKQIIIQNAVTKGLDPNAKMKDSGVEWIGEIPEDWTKITLKRVFNKRIAGSWGNDENQGYKNTICLRIADFDYSKLKFKDSKSYTIRSYSEKEILNKSIKRGDLLIEKSGGGEKTPVGRMVVYDLDLNNPMYANFMEKLSVRYFANSYYINYIMSAFYHSRAIWPYVKATTGIQNLDITNLLANEIIFIPSLSEQLSIVNYICSKTSQIDNNIHQCNKMITLLQERKQIIINDVVTGKIKVI